MLSAGRPVVSSVMATNEVHVSCAPAVQVGAVVPGQAEVVVVPAACGGGRGTGEDEGGGSRDGCQGSESHHRALHDLRPVVARPWTKCFCSAKNTMRIGTTTTIAPASRSPYWVEFCPTL